MYCPKCGMLNPDGVKLCQLCSWVLRDDGTSTVAENPLAKTSGAAKAALILTIISIFTLGLTALPAFICGIVGVINIEKSGGSLKGKGYAVMGLFAPVTLVLLMLAILMPALSKVRPMAMRVQCAENLNDIDAAMMLYVYNNDGKLPDASSWSDQIESNTDIANGNFICPSSDVDDCSYAMNVNAAGKALDSLPADMVLVFESTPGCNQAGGPELLNPQNHSVGCNIMFCDGTVEFVKAENFHWLVWDVTEIKEIENAEN